MGLSFSFIGFSAISSTPRDTSSTASETATGSTGSSGSGVFGLGSVSCGNSPVIVWGATGAAVLDVAMVASTPTVKVDDEHSRPREAVELLRVLKLSQVQWVVVGQGDKAERRRR